MEQPQPAQLEQTARQKFGEVLRFHREQRQYTTRRVADMIGQSRESVENHEAGHTVPDGKAWDKYCGIVSRGLRRFAELRQRALAEAAAERETIIRSMEHHKMATANGANGHKPPIIGTNLGDKLIAATQIPAPDSRTVNPGQPVTYHSVPPKTDNRITAGDTLGVSKPGVDRAGRARMPNRPVGSMTHQAIEERIAWARLQLRQRPRMPINGADGLLVLLRKRFGIGLDPDVCIRIKREVHEEMRTLPPAVPAGVESAPVPPPVEIPRPVVVKRVEEPKPKDPAEDISSAVHLILESVPALRTFTITVDDKGEASVEYTVREVRVVESGGSLKVRR